MESIITDYISHELADRPDLLPLTHDTPLLESGRIDSLSLVKLILFIEKQFNITVDEYDVVPENFETIDAICGYIRTRQ